MAIIDDAALMDVVDRIRRRGVRLEALLTINVVVCLMLCVTVWQQNRAITRQAALMREAIDTMSVIVQRVSDVKHSGDVRPSSVELRGGDQQVFVGAEAALDRLAKLSQWTTEEAAEVLGVNQDTVRRRIQEGDLKATKDESGQWRVDNPSETSVPE